MSITEPVHTTPDASQSVDSPVHVQAHKLLAEAGSAEIAKHAVDTVARDTLNGSPGDKFAVQWGFDSYLSLFEASIPLASVGGKNWCLTSLRGKNWILWNDADLVARQYASREEAEQQVQEGVHSAPSEPVGLDT